MEEWSSVNRAAFPATHAVNGIDKSAIDADIKYAQVKQIFLHRCCTVTLLNQRGTSAEAISNISFRYLDAFLNFRPLKRPLVHIRFPPTDSFGDRVLFNKPLFIRFQSEILLFLCIFWPLCRESEFLCIASGSSIEILLSCSAAGHMQLSHAVTSSPVRLWIYILLSVCLQPSSTLSSYVSACAYSPTNQYGVYSGSAGGYVAPGHHHWQPQSPALSHPGSGMGMHTGDLHSPMAFKHQVREGTEPGGGCFNVKTGNRRVKCLKILKMYY